jgi:hypothetical protein
MPSRALHAELNRLMRVSDPGMEIQRLIDSTARTHGPSHRDDEIHSLGGVIAELSKRGALTTERVRAAAAHLAQDRMWDEVSKRVPVRGPLRQPTRQLLEATLVQLLRSRRRR